jgi:hypothetical protein
MKAHYEYNPMKDQHRFLVEIDASEIFRQMVGQKTDTQIALARATHQAINDLITDEISKIVARMKSHIAEGL